MKRITTFFSCAITNSSNFKNHQAGKQRNGWNTSALVKGVLFFHIFQLTLFSTSYSQVVSSRMNEVFLKTDLVASSQDLGDPWEITYGPDDSLWVTEAKGYKVKKVHPTNGGMRTVLDISRNATFLPLADRTFNAQFSISSSNPQGGLMGLAIHPDFMHATAPKKYVYLGYVHTNTNSTTYTNRLVRFTYNTSTGTLGSPVSLCDTLPGSNDHNSGRMIIAPVSGTYYLFYAEGDMGAGQFSNASRTIKAQNTASYEGKILRFNLEADADAGSYDKWIPDNNPFNGANESAVWSTGIRNNQGFAYATINGTGYLYGSSHGPFSDDEINIIESGKNYGHPIVIGDSTDGNYNNAKAGESGSSLPLITSETTNARGLGTAYGNPIYSFYKAPKGNNSTPWSVQYIYTNQDWDASTPGVQGALYANGYWSSEAPSGMDIYTGNYIPGWKNSLLLGSLKGGKVMRLKLNTAGNGITSTAGGDTVHYFRSVNRFRDIAIAPDGKSIFVVIDSSSTTSGPTESSPVVSGCAGCLQKYTFLGYNTVSGKSALPATLDISTTTANTVTAATTVTINSTNSNNNVWVPITGPDGNIVAEINANTNNLGTVTTSYYTNSGTVREDASKRLYLDRNITITPQTQPSSNVSIRLYLTTAEFNALKNATSSQGMPSGVTAIGDIQIRKNNDAAGSALTAATTTVTPSYWDTQTGTTTGGYVLQASISSFSSFYFGNPSMTTLPLELVDFRGAFKNKATHLQWETANENNTAKFEVERSLDGQSFEKIGTVAAKGNSSSNVRYTHVDNEASKQSSSVLYYRLKMIDQDGSFSLSKVITVELGSSDINIYPNPISDELNLKLSLTRADRIQIQVTDMQGQVVYAQTKTVSAGNDAIRINTKSWSAQSYYVKVTGSDNKVLILKKVIKM